MYHHPTGPTLLSIYMCLDTEQVYRKRPKWLYQRQYMPAEYFQLCQESFQEEVRVHTSTILGGHSWLLVDGTFLLNQPQKQTAWSSLCTALVLCWFGVDAFNFCISVNFSPTLLFFSVVPLFLLCYRKYIICMIVNNLLEHAYLICRFNFYIISFLLWTSTWC
jgi:hypothetical protein